MLRTVPRPQMPAKTKKVSLKHSGPKQVELPCLATSASYTVPPRAKADKTNPNTIKIREQVIHNVRGMVLVLQENPNLLFEWFRKYGVGKWELLKACISREYLLMKRNSFVYIFKFIQLTFMAITEMNRKSVTGGGVYMGAIFFGLLMIMFNGMSELSMTINKLHVFYKQRDLQFFPPWAYALPTWILKIPITFVEVAIWVFITYYVIGFDPSVERLFRQYFVLVLANQMSSGLFRFIAATGRNMIVANTFGSFALLVLFALGCFVLARGDIKSWWIWGYWISPIMYEQNALMVNEFRANQWSNSFPNSTEPAGIEVLRSRGFFQDQNWYWIGGELILYLLSNKYAAFGASRAVVSDETEGNEQANGVGGSIQLTNNESSSNHVTGSESQEDVQRSISSKSSSITEATVGAIAIKKKGMVLPFEPHSITFDDIVSSVDVPQEMKEQGITDDRLVLLKGVSGAFRPGVLTALMDVSGAGKTTLMDVLAGWKTGGYIDGNITVSGFPKKQETFARVSGNCEQNDIHSPHVTVYESLLYSAWLRLPAEVNAKTRKMFIEEVMELVELNPLRHALVGLPGVNGLSTEQRKRLTIALFLMKRGGQEIYVGPLGHHSKHLIKYFEGIQGVRKIKDGYNPPTWMLEVTTTAQELSLGVDFADIYKNSDLYRNSVFQLSQSFLTQCAACLWKQHWSYWRNPPYTAVRFLFTTVIALMFGTLFWDLGSKTNTRQDLTNAMGSIYAAVLFLGIQNAASVQPVVAVERTVFYRERAAGMYSAMPYAFSQVLIELPYIFVQATMYGLIVYSMIGFEWTAAKFWYLFFMYFTLLYFTYYGMMAVAITPNYHIAAIVSAAFYGIWNLFSGFIVPRPSMPIWWRWYYWICPVSWTFYGLVVSQFGDIQTPLLDGEFPGQTDEQHFRSYYDFRHDFLGVVVAVILGFTVLFASIFTVSIRLFNFQRR
ncbi:Pleiotropic drug resistance protein 3 [Hibiscus syriacus]|uniref:Pleiotropic drug resistance protein 3 n=1 Tax=Hibiscus syriacus TaxID=106335 RepID=A0A6A2XP85_HIBSY|nr:Pleiotropic drug resistance protein 3 [Hibiscus syriacus]